MDEGIREGSERESSEPGQPRRRQTKTARKRRKCENLAAAAAAPEEKSDGGRTRGWGGTRLLRQVGEFWQELTAKAAAEAAAGAAAATAAAEPAAAAQAAAALTASLCKPAAAATGMGHRTVAELVKGHMPALGWHLARKSGTGAAGGDKRATVGREATDERVRPATDEKVRSGPVTEKTIRPRRVETEKILSPRVEPDEKAGPRAATDGGVRPWAATDEKVRPRGGSGQDQQNVGGPAVSTSSPGLRADDSAGQAEVDWWWRIEHGPAAWQEVSGRGGGGHSSPRRAASAESAAGAAAGPRGEARAQQLRDDFDPSVLPHELPTPSRGSRWSTNALRSETREFMRTAPMPESYTAPATEHTVVMHYQHQQIARMQAAAVPLAGTVAAGPSPYPDFDGYDGPDFDGGLRHGQYRGPAPPQTMEELFTDQTVWATITDWYRASCAEIARAEHGYSFQMSKVPGGQNGLTIPAEATKEEWRRLIWRDVGGRPVMVRETLPDSNSTVRLFDIYRDAMAAGVQDKEVCSMIALFGIVSNAALTHDTVLLPNYKAAWKHLKVLQEAFRAKREDFGAFPRATEARPRPHHHPSRLLPKGCVKQLKDDGRIKFRETVDGGAKRRRGEETVDGGAQRQRRLKELR